MYRNNINIILYLQGIYILFIYILFIYILFAHLQGMHYKVKIAIATGACHEGATGASFAFRLRLVLPSKQASSTRWRRGRGSLLEFLSVRKKNDRNVCFPIDYEPNESLFGS